MPTSSYCWIKIMQRYRTQKLRAYIMILMYARIIVPRKTGGSQNEMVKEPPEVKELRCFLTFCVSTEPALTPPQSERQRKAQKKT